MSAAERAQTAHPELQRASSRLRALFGVYLRWYLPRHFHAFRVAAAERFPRRAERLIVCINHASWWDPLVILALSQYLAPERAPYSPMEQKALEHYGFFARIGAFPVENDQSPRAAAQFLRDAEKVLGWPEAMLWMTPEGRFCDVRQRPLTWMRGTAALTRRLETCTVVPIAIEYAFWDERLPEGLCAVGEPMSLSKADAESTEERNERLMLAMAQTQDHLARLVQQRNGSLFETIFAGSAGVSITYDLWQRGKAALQGRPYLAEHGTIAPK